MDLVVVDVETSGINPFRHDVLAVGLAPMDPNLRSTVVYIRPESIVWSDLARRDFEKYSNEWMLGALSAPSACTVIESYFVEICSGRDATLVGHNIGFDIAFLRRLAFLGGREQLAGMSHRAIDTHTLLYVLAMQGKIPRDAVTSDGAFKHFGITVDERVRHTALGDAMATRELVRKVFDAFPKASHRLHIMVP